MGDRSNVLFKNKDSGVGVYAHWGGLGMAKAVATTLALPSFQARIGDPSYATRIGVQSVLEQLGSSPDEETGFGIWTPEGGADDNEYPYVVVDVGDGSVYVTTDFRKLGPEKKVEPTAEAIAARMSQWDEAEGG